mmetsp:Transcript_20949/g.39833  ORF Transcript_20949/g.39833 Transcript_20949/m.39833 type:complete len:228 (+) Transcript_20949:300-983(+)|eukprot:CAMPEP_0114315032 /NCGR_PEP_ID=MMETSP0059-20121206/22224_1 /TAXON_ID=36894 /ORGANISM="Pyramimonas parkeae, Strain CCMP726" /LENGTH=227 /DNA_ID=CAMNT_0001440411 /DNA_START=286 /DNA_END=969 /DNA_ORIENTATION=+
MTAPNVSIAAGQRQPSMGQLLGQQAIVLGSLCFGFLQLPKLQGTTLMKSPVTVLCSVLVLHIYVTLAVYSFGPMVDTQVSAIRRLVRGAGALAAGAAVFHALAVIYGAPLVDRFLLTHLWSWLLSTLTAAPTACVLGWHSNVWRTLYAKSAPTTCTEIALCVPPHFTLLGAWIGAWPVPLDWDRDWQVWPFPCIAGAVIGNAFGHVISFMLCWVWNARKHEVHEKAA